MPPGFGSDRCAIEGPRGRDGGEDVIHFRSARRRHGVRRQPDAV
jgi:hypothetical protein